MMKRMMDFFKKWFGNTPGCAVSQTPSECVSHTLCPSQEGKPKKALPSLLDDLEACLFGKYDFRFNVLTEQTEFRKRGEGDFRLVDQRMLNTFCMEARKQGVNCWDKDVSRLLFSEQVAEYHPFVEYVDSLPEWDGEDRIAELARRVSDEGLVGERIPSLDVGDGGSMDGPGRAVRQCRCSFINQQRAGALQIHLLFDAVAGGTATFLHRQVRFDQPKRMRTEALAFWLNQYG